MLLGDIKGFQMDEAELCVGNVASRGVGNDSA